MWVFTTRGFFSVVEEGFDEDRVLVRARAREDIGSLLALAKQVGIKGLRLRQTPDNDYLWRISMLKANWTRLLKEMSEEINYRNFKHAALDGEYMSPRGRAYMDVWLSMVRLQEELANPSQQQSDMDQDIR